MNSLRRYVDEVNGTACEEALALSRAQVIQLNKELAGYKKTLASVEETAYCAGWKQGYLHFEVEPWNIDAIALMQEAYTNYKYSIK